MPYQIVEQLNLEGRERFLKADLVVAQCGDEAFLLKSRKDEPTVSETPTLPDSIIAYERGGRQPNGQPVITVLKLRHNPQESQPEPVPSQGDWTEDKVRAILINPTYCLAEPPVVSEGQYIDANIRAIREMGAANWLKVLLKVLKG